MYFFVEYNCLFMCTFKDKFTKYNTCKKGEKKGLHIYFLLPSRADCGNDSHL